jgi:hypothetical protein
MPIIFGYLLLGTNYMTKYCFIDFEYNGTNQEYLNLISCSYSLSDKPNKKFTYWLFNNEEARYELKKDLDKLILDDYIFVAYNVLAEASAFYSLGINPIPLKWYDLYLEYRMITNHCHKYQYGKQLIDGKEKMTYPPKGFFNTEDSLSHQKPQHNLASACYKLLGELIDTDRKDRIRDLIISTPVSFTQSEIVEILEYNESDIELLPRLLDKFKDIWLELIPLDKRNKGQLQKEILLRGEYASRSAVIERVGYPVDMKACTNFFNNAQNILDDIMREINELFPEIAPFEWNKKQEKFSRREKKIFNWIDTLGFEWPRTETGKYSLTVDVFSHFFPTRHSYSKTSFGEQMNRLLKTRQSLNGFIPPAPHAKNQTTFFDSVGRDERSRAFMGIYGSQSSRSQPRSTSFIPLKSAWFRALIAPKKGRAIVGIDYSSQEFLLGGLIFKDKNAIKSYESGDVYFHFAKLAKAVPENALRKNHEEIRDLFKATVLGLSYQMSKVGLARKLSADTGKLVTQDDAQKFIEKFDYAYPDLVRGRDDLALQCKIHGHLKLPCGWYLFGDNQNFRSVSNFPIQGFGASIMRKAVALAQDAGLKVIFTLHDAIYVEYDSFDLDKIDLLKKCMFNAFIFYFLDTPMEEFSKLIRMDAKTWSPEYSIEALVTPQGMGVVSQTIYVDSRAKSEYEQFKRYL